MSYTARLTLALSLLYSGATLAVAQLHQTIENTSKPNIGLDNPREISTSKSAKFAFVVSADDNALSAFKVRANQKLSHLHTLKSNDSIKLEGANALVASKNGEHIYALSYYNGALGHFTFNDNKLQLKHQLTDGLTPSRVFKDSMPIPESIDTLGLLGGYDLAMSADEKVLFAAASASHGISIFRIAEDGEPALWQRINTLDDTALQGAVAIAVSPDGLYFAVGGMNGHAVSVYRVNEKGLFEHFQTITNELTMPLSLAFLGQSGQLAVAYTGSNKVVVFSKKQLGIFKHQQGLTAQTEGAFKGVGNITYDAQSNSIWLVAEQGNSVTQFKNEKGIWRLVNRISEGNGPTSASMLDENHIVISYGRGDALKVFQLSKKE